MDLRILLSAESPQKGDTHLRLIYGQAAFECLYSELTLFHIAVDHSALPPNSICLSSPSLRLIYSVAKKTFGPSPSIATCTAGLLSRIAYLAGVADKIIPRSAALCAERRHIPRGQIDPIGRGSLS